MFELIAVTIVCVTVLAGLFAVLGYLKAYRTERSAWLEMIRTELMSTVAERLDQQANYKKDLETVNTNQLALARELDLLKTQHQLKTNMRLGGRPPGSIV